MPKRWQRKTKQNKTEDSVHLMLDVEREGELVKLGEASVRCEGVSIHTGTGICVLWGVGVHIGTS